MSIADAVLAHLERSVHQVLDDIEGRGGVRAERQNRTQLTTRHRRRGEWSTESAEATALKRDDGQSGSEFRNGERIAGIQGKFWGELGKE
eukprot:2524859-Pleurochrysis_carterae.AAC.1